MAPPHLRHGSLRTIRRLIQFARSSDYRRKWRRFRTREVILAANEGRVVSGPFQGMKHNHRSVTAAYFPQLLGIYEKEIWPAVHQAAKFQPDVVVNVGAAEGYYAIGMARMLPEVPVVCFEMRSDWHFLLRRMARVNHVEDRIEIRGLCDHDSLTAALSLGQQPLVVCDIEGAELDLLDPVAVPRLRHSHILVELHDALHDRNIASTIRDRFQKTHAIEEFDAQHRNRQDLPSGIRMPRRLVNLAISEGRPEGMQWFWMRSESMKNKASHRAA